MGRSSLLGQQVLKEWDEVEKQPRTVDDLEPPSVLQRIVVPRKIIGSAKILAGVFSSPFTERTELNVDTMLGSFLVVLGGCCVAVFTMPLKYSKKWVWENQWLVGVTVMFFLLPLLELKLFVPQTMEILRQAGQTVIFWSFVAGLFQGSAGLLFAYGSVLMGVSMGFSVMISMILVFATMIPLVGAHREQVLSIAGITLICGVVMLISGAIMAGIAGKQRGETESAAATLGPTQGRKVKVGWIIFIAIWVGITASSNYILMEWGKGVTESAEAAGVAKDLSTFVILFPWYMGMFAFNLIYCTLKMVKGRTLKNYWTGGGTLPREFFLAASIGLLWYLGQGVLLIAGYRRLGELQVSIGSALFMGPVLIVSNLLGLATGEWKGVSRRTLRLLWMAILILIGGVVVTQIGNSLT